MNDSLERLCRAIEAARALDPAVSRTARLMKRGPAKMAKKLAEEAIEVAIDAVGGNRDDVVRESADLLYNLAVVWVAMDIKPQDIWSEMDRREKSLGIAEKLPKTPAKSGLKIAAAKPVVAGNAIRRPIAARAAGAKRR